jgi:hypothetical protein
MRQSTLGLPKGGVYACLESVVHEAFLLTPSFGLVVCFGGAASAVISTPTPTATPVNCDARVTFSGGNFTLSNGYVQTANAVSARITLSNQANLDLNGHTITRTNLNWGNHPRAIECTSSNDTVSGPGTIRGAFLY